MTSLKLRAHLKQFWTKRPRFNINMQPNKCPKSNYDTSSYDSAGEFQALQLIVLATFGVVDQPLGSCMLVHHLEIDF